MIGKSIILFAIISTMIVNANAALLCEIAPATTPDTCSNWTYNTSVNFNRVYDCSGGSLGITEFEVWAGCGPNAGSGDYSSPIVQTPSGVQLATNQAGRYCYCQIKSINGGANVASSPRWMFAYAYADAVVCASVCAHSCAYYARNVSAFRSALFQALQ